MNKFFFLVVVPTALCLVALAQAQNINGPSGSGALGSQPQSQTTHPSALLGSGGQDGSQGRANGNRGGQNAKGNTQATPSAPSTTTWGAKPNAQPSDSETAGNSPAGQGQPNRANDAGKSEGTADTTNSPRK